MKQINLEWQGQKFTIGEHEAFELGERLEDIVTLPELASMATNPKFRKLARCYSTMLSFAGARVTPEMVYSQMMSEIKSLDEDRKQLVVAEAISVLLEILMDGAPEGQGQDDGKKKNRSSKAAT
jgi:hypothetical protein